MSRTVAVLKDVDRGWAKLFHELALPTPSIAAIGILGEAAHAVHTGESELTTPPTVLDVAIWNEFGLGVPERSFLRETIDMNQDAILDRMVKEMRKVVDRKQSKEDMLERVGMFVVGLVQQRIADGIDPPNSERTIERKGSDKPLIDKGQLRSSITYEVR